MAENNLEQSAEKEMIPLVFLDVNFDGKSRYKRLDTKEILEGKVKILEPNLRVVMDYSGEGTIKMISAVEKSDGLLFPEHPKIGKLYPCRYCEIE